MILSVSVCEEWLRSEAGVSQVFGNIGLSGDLLDWVSLMLLALSVRLI